MKSPFQQKNGNFASGVKGGLAWCTKLLYFSDPITEQLTDQSVRVLFSAGMHPTELYLGFSWGPADTGVLCSVICLLCGRRKKNYRKKKLNVNDLANKCKPTTLDHCAVS